MPRLESRKNGYFHLTYMETKRGREKCPRLSILGGKNVRGNMSRGHVLHPADLTSLKLADIYSGASLLFLSRFDR